MTRLAVLLATLLGVPPAFAQASDAARPGVLPLVAIGAATVGGGATAAGLLALGSGFDRTPHTFAFMAAGAMYVGAVVGAKTVGDALGVPGSPGLAAIGAGLGAAGGGLFALTGNDDTSDGVVLALVTAGACGGAIAGYRLGAPRAARRTSVSVVPMATPHGAGAYAVVRF